MRPTLIASAAMAEEAARIADSERAGLAAKAKTSKDSAERDLYARLAVVAERRARHQRELAAAYRAIANGKDP